MFYNTRCCRSTSVKTVRRPYVQFGAAGATMSSLAGSFTDTWMNDPTAPQLEQRALFFSSRGRALYSAPHQHFQKYAKAHLRYRSIYLKYRLIPVCGLLLLETDFPDHLPHLPPAIDLAKVNVPGKKTEPYVAHLFYNPQSICLFFQPTHRKVRGKTQRSAILPSFFSLSARPFGGKRRHRPGFKGKTYLQNLFLKLDQGFIFSYRKLHIAFIFWVHSEPGGADFDRFLSFNRPFQFFD